MNIAPKTRRFIPFKAFPLQFVLIIPFILQIFGAVGLIGYLSFKNGQKAVNDLATQLINRTSSVAEEHLNSYLSIPHKVIEINADAIEMGLLDVKDRQTLGKYFWRQMQTYNLSYIGIGLTTGEGVGAARYDGKTVTIDDWSAKPPKNWYSYAVDEQGNRTQVLEILDWDNFSEPWYTEAVKASQPTWTSINVVNYPGQSFISTGLGRPIYNAQKQKLGMISADISLLKLSDFLRTLDVSRSGQVFILERNGMLVANSGQQQPFTLVTQKIQRLKASDSGDPMIRGVAQQIHKRFNGFESIRTTKTLKIELNRENHYVQITPWQDPYGLELLVVVSVPENVFMAQIHENTHTTILLCLGALGVATILGIFTAHWIVQPILRLNRASEAIASGNLDQTVEESPIEELKILAGSFNYMARQLRESFAALEQSNEELEDRVEQRTVELKNALGELQRTQAQVIQSEKMSSLGQLVAGVAHEINNPVNFIHGNLSHLDDYLKGLLELIELYQQGHSHSDPEIQALADEIDLEFLIADLQKMLSSMKIGTERIRNIVLSLRNFSRMDEAEFKAVDIHEGIESTLLILQHRLKAKPEHPAIEVIRDYAQLPEVECYAGQLNQVLMNILVNAIEALDERNATRTYQEVTENPAQIRIRTALIDSQWVEIAIADNGAGISEQVQTRIFDPFFTTKPVGKGTGMGMAISYQIITEKHGGKLQCISMLGKGTEFIILIPCRQARFSQVESVVSPDSINLIKIDSNP